MSLILKILIMAFTAELSFAATTKSEDPEAMTVSVVLGDKELESAEVGKAQYVWLVDADDGFSGKCVAFDKDKKTAVFKVDNKTFWLDANVKKRRTKVNAYKKDEVKRKKEEAEKKRKELAEKRQKEVEAKRKKLELERKKKELEVLKKKQEAEKKRAELAEQRRQKLLEMQKKQEEADKKRREMAEKRRLELEKKKEEDRKKRDAILAQKKKEALEEKKRLADIERKKKQEEEKRNEAIKKLQEEEARKLAEEERRLREEEARLRGETLPVEDTKKKSNDRKQKDPAFDVEKNIKNGGDNFDNFENNSSSKKVDKPDAVASKAKVEEERAKKEALETTPSEPKVVVSEAESQATHDAVERSHGHKTYEAGLNLTDLNITRLLSLGAYFGYRLSDTDIVQFYFVTGRSPALQSMGLESSMYSLRLIHFWKKAFYTNTGLGMQTITTSKDADLADETTEIKTTDIVLDAALGTELAWRPFGKLTMRIDWVGVNARVSEMSNSKPDSRAGDSDFNDKVDKHAEQHENLRRMQAYLARIQLGMTF